MSIQVNDYYFVLYLNEHWTFIIYISDGKLKLANKFNWEYNVDFLYLMTSKYVNMIWGFLLLKLQLYR